MGSSSSVSHPRVSSDLSPGELERIVNSEAQLREAQTLASIGSWEWDIRKDTITWSDELYRMYGVAAEDQETFDTSFDSFMALIHPNDRELLGATVQKAMETHERYSVDHRLVRPDGEVRFLHGQGAVVVEDGEPVRMYGIAQDVTEQRLAYKQRLQLDQAEKNAEFRAQLLHIVAHELNTPLTPLQLQMHVLIQDSEKLDDRHRKAVELIERNIRRLTMLVSDVLDMSRSETGNLSLRKSPLQVQAVIQDVVDTFEVLAQENDVTLDTSGTDQFELVADAHRITQVLQNLVKNAIKFTPKGGRISIRAKEDDDEASFEVEDTGRGLTPEKIERLFQPFAQVHEDQGSGGHGLGLYISQSIVEAHGGALEVESAGEGKGSTFRFRIPNGEPEGA